MNLHEVNGNKMLVLKGFFSDVGWKCIKNIIWKFLLPSYFSLICIHCQAHIYKFTFKYM